MCLIVELFIILFAKIAEVSLSTLRTVFVGRGEKHYAAAVGFIEVIIWLNVASAVLVNIQENPSKMFVYALGFAIGILVGLIIEEKIGMGYCNVQIITNTENGLTIAKNIRDLGRAVTILEGKGKESESLILTTFIKRKDKDSILNLMKKENIPGVITITETQKIYGGFGIK